MRCVRSAPHGTPFPHSFLLPHDDDHPYARSSDKLRERGPRGRGKGGGGGGDALFCIGRTRNSLPLSSRNLAFCCLRITQATADLRPATFNDLAGQVVSVRERRIVLYVERGREKAKAEERSERRKRDGEWCKGKRGDGMDRYAVARYEANWRGREGEGKQRERRNQAARTVLMNC